MKQFLFFCTIFFSGSAFAQHTDTTVSGNVTVIKDPRIDMLGDKMADYNDALSLKVKTGKGYRLMIISTNDRALAMKVRSELYRLFPDQKQYMTYQVPNIRIKFGNYQDKGDAEKMQKQLMTMKLVPNNIYVLPENDIEIKPDKKDADATP